MRNIVIIPCSGTGKRMKSDIPKQFLKLNGKEIICHTIDKFERCKKIDEIILVISKDYERYFENEILAKNNFKKISNIVFGGEERINSVYNGLCAVKDEENIILIHDAVRPFIKIEHIENIIYETEINDACVLGVKVKDTIKICDNDKITKTPDRNQIWLAQTPQAFKYSLIKKAYETAINTNFFGTDDASLVENIEHYPKMILGDYENIKITTPEDLKIGKLLL